MKIEYVVLDEKLKIEELSGYIALLPHERQEKIARYRFEKDKLLSLAAGLLIRRAIGESEIALGEHGKPYAQNGVYFSVSHSGRVAAIAVDDIELGLDVEEARARTLEDRRPLLSPRRESVCERSRGSAARVL